LIHAIAHKVKFAMEEDTLCLPSVALLTTLGIYVFLRICEEVLKALIIRRKGEAIRTHAID